MTFVQNNKSLWHRIRCCQKAVDIFLTISFLRSTPISWDVLYNLVVFWLEINSYAGFLCLCEGVIVRLLGCIRWYCLKLDLIHLVDCSPSGLLLARSNLPISKKRPPFARQRTDANSFSSARELSTRSTPRPSVSIMTSCSNEQSRELPMWLSLICSKLTVIALIL